MDHYKNVKNYNPVEIIYRFNQIHYNLIKVFIIFTEIKFTVLKFIWKHKRPQIPKQLKRTCWRDYRLRFQAVSVTVTEQQGIAQRQADQQEGARPKPKSMSLQPASTDRH